MMFVNDLFSDIVFNKILLKNMLSSLLSTRLQYIFKNLVLSRFGVLLDL